MTACQAIMTAGQAEFHADHLDGDDADDGLMRQLRDDVDEVLAKTGLFHGIEPSTVSALTKQLHRIYFPRG
jgi:hypothetical protein